LDGVHVYGNDTLPNAGYCGVGEMWGYYIGGMLASRELNRNRFSGDDNWFEPIIFRQLTGVRPNTERPILTSPLTEKQIFDCLTSDVTNHTQLRNRLIQRYGRQQEITAVFADFGF
jgi:hypothetical protein